MTEILGIVNLSRKPVPRALTKASLAANLLEKKLALFFTFFDRLISFSDKSLTYKGVIEHLNILDYDYYFKITDYLLTNNIKELLNIFN